MSNNYEPCAIVVIYNGRKMTEEQFAALSANIVENLVNHGIAIPELTTAKFLDSSDIAKLLSGDDMCKVAVKVKDEKQDPVENALKYLSTRYKEFLGNSNMTPLTLQLSNDIQSSEFSKGIGKKHDEALMNALYIVCDENTVFSPQLAKYGISDRVMNTIQQCYSFYAHSN